MNVILDYITFLQKCDCCGTNFLDIAFISLMETVINNSTKSMEVIPVSFYTEVSHPKNVILPKVSQCLKCRTVTKNPITYLNTLPNLFPAFIQKQPIDSMPL